MAWTLEEHFRLLMGTSAGYAILITDRKGIIRSWSSGAEDLFGYPSAEIVGQPTDVLFSEEDRQAGVPQQEMDRALRHDRSADVTWHVRKDGSRFWGSGAMAPLFDPNGEHVGFGKIVRDETPAKELQLELESERNELARAQVHTEHFLSMLAHELRNPVTAIRYFVEFLRLSRGMSPEQVAYCRMIDTQLGDIQRLIDGVADMTRIRTGKTELRMERLDARRIMQEAVETVAPLLESRDQHLSVSYPDDMLVEADPLRLKQIFVNLLSNAAKFTEEGGDVWFEAAPQEDWAFFRIRDSGVGIPREEQMRIFDLFTQIEHAYWRAQGSLGIGLNLVRRLVELHGGTIDVQSGGPGEGSQFTVRLKLAAQEAVPEPS